MAGLNHLGEGAGGPLTAALGTTALRRPARPASGRIVLFDDFTGTTLDTTLWRPSTYANNEGDSEGFAASQVSVASSLLTLSATYSAGGTSVPNSVASWGAAPTSTTYNYLTGQVTSAGLFDFLYGTVEIRAKMSNTTGMGCALWLLGCGCDGPVQVTSLNTGPCQWPTPGSSEVDICEVKGSSPTTLYMTSHRDTTANSNRQSQLAPTVADLSAAFHLYTLVWTPATLTWLLDGVQQYQITDVTFVPQEPLFILLSTYVGGTWWGAASAGTGFPASMQVDYVRVTQ